MVPDDLFDEDWKSSTLSGGLATRETKKIEKKDKIAVVRSWLSQSDVLKQKESSVHLDFNDEAKVVANRFISEVKRGKKQTEDGTGKLDDLADCLLQGVAWVRWEENQRKIRDLLDAPAT